MSVQATLIYFIAQRANKFEYSLRPTGCIIIYGHLMGTYFLLPWQEKTSPSSPMNKSSTYCNASAEVSAKAKYHEIRASLAR